MNHSFKKLVLTTIISLSALSGTISNASAIDVYTLKEPSIKKYAKFFSKEELNLFVNYGGSFAELFIILNSFGGTVKIDKKSDGSFIIRQTVTDELTNKTNKAVYLIRLMKATEINPVSAYNVERVLVNDVELNKLQIKQLMTNMLNSLYSS